MNIKFINLSDIRTWLRIAEHLLSQPHFHLSIIQVLQARHYAKYIATASTKYGTGITRKNDPFKVTGK